MDSESLPHIHSSKKRPKRKKQKKKKSSPALPFEFIDPPPSQQPVNNTSNYNNNLIERSPNSTIPSHFVTKPLEFTSQTKDFFLKTIFDSETKLMNEQEVLSLVEDTLRAFFGVVGTSMHYELLSHQFPTQKNQNPATCIFQVDSQVFNLFWTALSFHASQKATIRVVQTSPFLHDLTNDSRTFFQNL